MGDVTPKILGLDIETLYGVYAVFNPYDAGPLPIGNCLEPSRMIMWGAKWLGRAGVMQADERDGAKAMFRGIRDLIAEADMVVSYNGEQFDLPWINGGIVEHRLPALPAVTSLDLYKVVRKLRYQSSKLAYVAPLLEIGEKVKNAGMELWHGVRAGDAKSWRDMIRYNRGDVTLLDSGYARLRPYIPNHPRLHPSSKNRPNCGACGAAALEFRGTYRTLTMTYDRGQCRECGKWDNKLNGRRT